MTSIVINGNAYSDDGSTPQDMQHYGYLTHLLPMIGDTATVAGQVTIDAAQAALDAVTASNGALALRGTSTTSLAVSAGTKTLTTQTGKQFTAGNYVTISRTSAPTTLMHGVVTSYSGATLIVEAATIAGSGTFTDWTIALSGAKGDTGPTGNGQMAYLAKTGTYTVTAADKGKLIDCTSGTFTLSFQACATLGADWTTYIRNSGTGVITLDPNGAETIDGAATYTLNPGSFASVQCDGSVLRVAVDVPSKLVRLPILSAETVNAWAASNLETIENGLIDTGIGSLAVFRVVYGNSLFIASTANGGAASNVATSPDGTTWTLRSMPSSAAWNAVTDGTSKFIATAAGATATAKSTDGITWSSATALPTAANSTSSHPCFAGSTVLVVATTATTLYTSTDNGTTWGTQTLPAAATTHPRSVGGLFLIQTSSTQYYTSATGATGTWTLRSFPITSGDLTQDSDGSFYCFASGNYFKTTDGINWTDLGYGSVDGATRYPALINGVMVNMSSTLGGSATRHNGVWVLRKSLCAPVFTGLVKNTAGTIFVGGNNAANGKVIRVAPAESTAATALFTR